MKKYSYRVVYGLVILAFIIFLVTLTAIGIWSSYLSHHRVVDSSPHFSALWTSSDVALNTTWGQREDGSAIFLLIYNENLVFVENQHFGNTYLKSLNLQNGKSRWQTEIQNNQRGLAIVNDLQQVYIGYSKAPAGSSGSTRGSFTISAYSLMTGKLAWSRTYEGISVISKMSINNSTIAVNGSSGHGAFFGNFLLEVSTGNVISSTLSETPLPQGSNRTAFLQRENVTDDIDLVRTTKNVIYALDVVDDVVLWRIDKTEVASNFSVNEDIVYFLTQNAQLLALDTKSGEQIGNVVFEPGYLSQTYPIHHHVSTNDNMIVVYIEDSQSLFAFRLLQDEQDEE